MFPFAFGNPEVATTSKADAYAKALVGFPIAIDEEDTEACAPETLSHPSLDGDMSFRVNGPESYGMGWPHTYKRYDSMSPTRG